MYGDRSGQHMQLCSINIAVNSKMVNVWKFSSLLICMKMHRKAETCKNEDGINLCQNRDYLWPLVTTVMPL